MADLGKILITPRGDYNKDTNYETLDLIIFNNSSFLALHNIRGIEPIHDMVNWMMIAKGYPGDARGIECVDTNGILINPGEKSNTQSLMDCISDKIINSLVDNETFRQELSNYMIKSMMSNIQTNSTDNVPTSALVHLMNQAIIINTRDISNLKVKQISIAQDNPDLMKKYWEELPNGFFGMVYNNYGNEYGYLMFKNINGLYGSIYRFGSSLSVNIQSLLYNHKWMSDNWTSMCKNIQYGKSFFPPITSAETQTCTVTFDIPFKSVPVVIASWCDNHATFDYCSYLVIPQNAVTTTKFDAIMRRIIPTANWWFSWIAISDIW